MFDTKLPERLKALQSWFASIITRGIDVTSRIKPTTPSGNTIVDEAAKYISPSHSLQPWQRVQIYNQQYWWRLLDVLHETLPLATHLFGYRDFNEFLAIPYLECFPPNDWSLNTLADRFPQWVKDNYHDHDKNLLHDALLIDVAFQRGFFAEQKAPLQSPDLSVSLLKAPLSLQPAITFFNLPYHLFNFRKEVIEVNDGDYYLNHPLPKLDHTAGAFIIYRDSIFNMRWDILDPDEYLILSQLSNGTTLEKACSCLDAKMIERKLRHWFDTWTANGWLVHGK